RLEQRIKRRLRGGHQKLTADGKLLSRAQLEGYYRTFRNRFGPDVLSGLDGEALLETMHAHGNRDSLVYWLEFKNDEEFPARFGSIAGGSALKFRIFRRKETNERQIAAKHNYAKSISAHEAVPIPRKHRRQVL